MEAATGPDRDLDRALSDLGVLPPMELGPIRQVLRHRDTTVLLAANDDGHAIVQVVTNARLVALIHHDGRLQALNPTAA